MNKLNLIWIIGILFLISLNFVFADESIFRLSLCAFNVTQVTNGSQIYSNNGAGTCSMYYESDVNQFTTQASFAGFPNGAETVYFNVTYDISATGTCPRTIEFENDTNNVIVKIEGSMHAACGGTTDSIGHGLTTVNPTAEDIINRGPDGFVTQKWMLNKTTMNFSVWNNVGTLNSSRISNVISSRIAEILFGFAGNAKVKINFTKFEMWNVTDVVVPDTTPPSITYYNLTSSDNGCESWNTDKNTACSTSSVTPTVQFNTSENAWCAISGNSSETLGKNYTEMGSLRNCTGATSGEGTREHFCTLTNEDELVYDTSYIYISCKDANNNQNISGTSTSGALKLSITGLENAGRTSIGIGIQNALNSSYTNYTDLQIYARNLANTQVRGTFDRAAKKGSRMWAFNRIGVSDSHVNMFNLTPVLYTLELANRTSTNITLEVEKLINATK